MDSSVMMIMDAQLESLDATDMYASAWQNAVDRYAQQQQQQQQHLRQSSTSIPNGSVPLPSFRWGGRGQGGRGTARRTFQLRDVIVKDTVRLEYAAAATSAATAAASRHPLVGTGASSPASTSTATRLLLDHATLKLLSGHVYALMGRNGLGKSTLLKRLAAGKIPGVPPWIQTVYVGQEPMEMEMKGEEEEIEAGEMDGFRYSSSRSTKMTKMTMTPRTYLQRQLATHQAATKVALRNRVQLLEEQLDSIDDMLEQYAEQLEFLSEELVATEEALQSYDDYELPRTRDDEFDSVVSTTHVDAALECMGVPERLWSQPLGALSPGMRQKTRLALARLCPACSCDILLLDEPTKHLDVAGLIRLRHMIQNLSDDHRHSSGATGHSTTILIVSHDLDLINDVATDMMELSQRQLGYVPGNYDDYLAYRQQMNVRELRHEFTLTKKRESMLHTLEQLKQQPTPKRAGGAAKKAKQISAQKKKLEKIQRMEHATTGVHLTTGSSETSSSITLAERRQRPPPDKAVQFVFRRSTCTWDDEPLISVLDVSCACNAEHTRRSEESTTTSHLGSSTVIPQQQDRLSSLPASRFHPPPGRPGYFLDSIDLCIQEGQIYCIVGENMVGKSTFLRLLAKKDIPHEGTIHYAAGLDVGFVDGDVTVDEMMHSLCHEAHHDRDPTSRRGSNGGSNTPTTTALHLLTCKYPTLPENDIRKELTNFGVSPHQAAISLQFLSGGERRRLNFASVMLGNPHLLLLDQPTNDLDMESVEALIVGLNDWKERGGTVVMVSHDASFVRELGAICYALVRQRLYRVEGGIDTYLRSYHG